MPLPTDEQLKEYAAKLAPIYRALLSAFPAVSPRRRVGDGLTLDTIQDYVEDNHPDERVADVRDGLNQLETGGFLESLNRWSFYKPTPLGERLIEALTGSVPASQGPPPLPQPTWG